MKYYYLAIFVSFLAVGCVSNDGSSGLKRGAVSDWVADQFDGTEFADSIRKTNAMARGDAHDQKATIDQQQEAQEGRRSIQILSDHDLVLAYFKLSDNPDYEKYVDSYMRKFRPELYEQARNDEFELKRTRIETVSSIKEQVEMFDLSKEYTLVKHVVLDEYNFVREAFPVSLFSENENVLGETVWLYSNFPKFSLYFDACNFAGEIPMGVEEASSFIKSRKGTDGMVDRVVAAAVTFRIAATGAKAGEFRGRIGDITFFEPFGVNKGRIISEFNSAESH